MALKYNRMALLAKTESSYGSDPTLSASADAVLVGREVEITPFAGDEVTRENIQSFLGARQRVPVATRVEIGFSVECAGSGAAGTAPPWAPLLRACGFAETITDDTAAAYSPASASHSSLAVEFFLDGNRHQISGARGNVALEFTANQLPMLRFSFTGLYVAPRAAALVTPNVAAFQQPLHVSNSNTPTFTLHGHSGILTSLSLDVGNNVAHKDRVNSAVVDITDRDGSGTAVFELPLLSTQDFFAAAKAATLGPLQLVHGIAPGNIITIDCPKVQVRQPTLSESDNDAMLNATLSLVPETGDDEITITCS